MASLGDGTNLEISSNHVVEVPMHANGGEPKPSQELKESTSNIDYSERGQWLRAALLGANDGLVSVASLMIGVGAVKENISAMIVAGLAGSVAGACSMAIGEFVSVYTQYDIERAQIKRSEKKVNIAGVVVVGEEAQRVKLPNPFQAALASALAFSVGALVPLLAAAFIRDYKIRLPVIAAVSSLALLVFGGFGAVLGKSSVRKSCVRVLIGGWMAMAVTFGLTKLFGFAGI